MKTIFTITFLFVAYYSFSQWIQQTSGTTEYLNSVCFTDSLNGWVAGNHGIILHTKDGGNSWEEQASESNSRLNGICFVDSLNGWAIGRIAGYPPRAQVLHTTNGGINWEKQIDNELIFPYQGIYFTDELNGWVIGGPYHTSDGGEKWEAQNGTGFNYSGDLCFTDSLNGWIACSSVDGSTEYVHSKIIHTNNGGETWEYQFDTLCPGHSLFGIYFIDSLKGWVAGGYPALSEIILKTTDGGNNWDTAYINDPGTLRSIYFADTFNGWAVGYNGSILYSSDGGNTWDSIPSGTDQILNSVYFTENGLGWIVGNGGTILHADYSQIVGLDELTGVQNKNLDIRCYPNPFSTSTTIAFESTQLGKVELNIYNQLGELIEIIQKNAQPGKQTLTWDASNLPSGIYFIRLQSGNGISTQKVVKL